MEFIGHTEREACYEFYKHLQFKNERVYLMKGKAPIETNRRSGPLGVHDQLGAEKRKKATPSSISAQRCPGPLLKKAPKLRGTAD